MKYHSRYPRCPPSMTHLGNEEGSGCLGRLFEEFSAADSGVIGRSDVDMVANQFGVDLDEISVVGGAVCDGRCADMYVIFCYPRPPPT